MSYNSKELKIKYAKGDSPSQKKNPNVADMSKLGYRDDSPYNTMPYIDIHTTDGIIDMSHTGIPLLANGRYLPPYSGLHKFTEKVIRERPAAKSGGWLDQYQDGGSKVFSNKNEFNKAKKAYDDSLNNYLSNQKDVDSLKLKLDKGLSREQFRDFIRNRNSEWFSTDSEIKTNAPDYLMVGKTLEGDKVFHDIIKKPVVEPIYKDHIRKAVPSFGFDPPPVDSIKGPNGILKREGYDPRVWDRATNVKQKGGATKVYTDKAEFDKANRAYRDSLYSYNFTKEATKKWKDRVEKYGPLEDMFNKENISVKDYLKYHAQEEVQGDETRQQEYNRVSGKIKPTSIDFYKTTDGGLEHLPDTKAIYNYKKPVVKPIFEEVVPPRMATPTFGFEQPPISEIMMQDGNRMSNQDFIKRHGEAQWKKATNQMQSGGQFNLKKVVDDFYKKQQAAEDYTNKSTGTTLKQRQDKAGVNPYTSEPYATGEAEYSFDPITDMLLPFGIAKAAKLFPKSGNIIKAAEEVVEDVPVKAFKPKIDRPVESQLQADTRAGAPIIDQSDIDALDPDMLEELKKDVLKDNFNVHVKPGWYNKLNLSEQYPGLAKAPEVDPNKIVYTNIKDLKKDLEYNEVFDKLFKDYMSKKSLEDIMGTNPAEDFKELYNMIRKDIKAPVTEAQKNYFMNKTGYDPLKEEAQSIADDAIMRVNRGDKESKLPGMINPLEPDDYRIKYFKSLYNKEITPDKSVRFNWDKKWDLPVNKKGGETKWLNNYK